MDEAQVRALVSRLLDEFKNELKDVRDDVDYLMDDVYNLGDRVTALEQDKGPRVAGWADYRIGLASQGSDLVGVSAASLSGNSNDIEFGDNEFDNLTVKLGAEGKITDELYAKIMLKNVDARFPEVRYWGEPGYYDYYPDAAAASSGSSYVTGSQLYKLNSNRDPLFLDEAYLDFTFKTFPWSRTIVGRQYQSYGLGLLVNNSRESQQGLRLIWDSLWNSPLSLEGFAGGSNYTFDTPFRSWGGDGYLSARLSYKQPSWSLAVNALADGVGAEQGYSADFWARFWGAREIKVEWAVMNQDALGNDFSGFSDPEAFMAMADIWKGNNWGLKGFYSAAGAHYNVWNSSLNPYFELYGDEQDSPWIPWERFLRNPLILSNVKTTGGMLNWMLFGANWNAQYYFLAPKSEFWGNTQWSDCNGNSMFYDDQVPYNRLWSVGLTKNVADGVDVNLTYAKQLANGDTAYEYGLDDAQLVVLGVAVGF